MTATSILRATGHRTMPWKNGGGSTTEIAVAPEGAGLDGFDWRISMALVAADGPFSAFPEIDRTLSILEGGGLVLHGLDQGPVRLERMTAPFTFPADATVSTALLDGPITDLNVMVRRGRFRDRTRRLSGRGPLTATAEGSVAFLIAVAPCRVTVGDGRLVSLDRNDTLRLDAPGGTHLAIAADGPVEACLVEIAPA